MLSLQTIVSRNIDPLDATSSPSASSRRGSAYNVIPADVHIGGTTRTTTPANRDWSKRRIEEICDGAAQMYGVKIEVEHRPGYPPTVNNAEHVSFALDVAAGVCGEHGVRDNVRPSMGAEDFSYMLEKVPGAMVRLGNGGEPRRSACTTRATTSTTWRSRSASASSCAPSSASSAKRA